MGRACGGGGGLSIRGAMLLARDGMHNRRMRKNYWRVQVVQVKVD